MTDANRIRLAEMIGWKWKETSDNPIQEWEGGKWYNPRGIERPQICGCEVPPHGFNPYKDANDTEAVIAWLNERNNVVHTSVAAHLSVVTIEGKQWSGKDWKEGVCVLALEVLDRE